jgi:hypothetical protein
VAIRFIGGGKKRELLTDNKAGTNLFTYNNFDTYGLLSKNICKILTLK